MEDKIEIIVGKNAGFCYGVLNAISNSIKITKERKGINIYCLGQIVHNRLATNMVLDEGIKIIEDLDEVTSKDALIIIRAHGVGLDVYKKIEELGYEILDLTCPHVKKIQKKVRVATENDYFICIVGIKTHPEVIGLVGHSKDSFVVSDFLEIEQLYSSYKKTKLKKMIIVSQTTFNHEKFISISNKIKYNISECEVDNTICSATKIRQEEVKEMSKNVDAMIIIGGVNSSNTKKLYDIAKESNANCFLVESVEDLDIDDIKEIKFENKKIGLMAGASTPKQSIEEVEIKLKKSLILKMK